MGGLGCYWVIINIGTKILTALPMHNSALVYFLLQVSFHDCLVKMKFKMSKWNNHLKKKWENASDMIGCNHISSVYKKWIK